MPLPRVHVGYRAPVFGDPRLDALDLAGQILSGGKGSRLNRRLVRDEQIAQDVAIFTLGFIGGASITAGWATVRPGVSVSRVEAALHEELARLTTELVTDDELARAKALTEADELGSLQRVEERADRLSMYATLFDDPSLINRMLPRYLAVTPEAIREVAAAVFRPDNRVVLTYLPEGSTADDVAVEAGDGQAAGGRRGGCGMSATVDPSRDGPVVAERPSPGAPRSYEFPGVRGERLANGLSVLVVDLPGRPLVSASLILTGGVAEEPADKAGATVLAARALTEGTEQHDAIALVEATERLGASLHADAGWDAVSVGVDVPAARLAPALELAAEVLLQPTFPEAEVDRLRDERLNDLLQARADPRRRVDEAFVGTIYTAASPYHRPSGGTRETVEGLTPDDLRRAFGRSLDPARATLIIGGDLGDQDCVALAERLFGGWSGNAASQAAAAPVVDTGSSVGRVIHVVHRPGSVQTEIRIGHRGLPRRIDDFHAVSVMAAILGGLFNSRLNMKLREEKGYTYGAGAGFDMRRGAGPFSARAAVNTEVTVPAILDTLAELTRMRDTTVADCRAGGCPRLPDRRLPAPLRDGRRRRRVDRKPRRPRARGRGAHRLSREDRGRRHGGHRDSRPGTSPRRRRGDRARRRRGRVRCRPRGGRARAARDRAGRCPGAGHRDRGRRGGPGPRRQDRRGRPDRRRRGARAAGVDRGVDAGRSGSRGVDLGVPWVVSETFWPGIVSGW